MEALSQMFTKAKSKGFITGFKVGRKDGELLEVSHLLFANNILIFYDVNPDQLNYLSWAFVV